MTTQEIVTKLMVANLASTVCDEDGQRWLWCGVDGVELCDQLELLGVVTDKAEDDGYVYRVVDAAALAGL